MPKHKPKQFYCPLGVAILWHRGLEYSECPLPAFHRDMPECKECKLCKDKEWKVDKDRWKPKKRKRKNKKGNKRANAKNNHTKGKK